MEECRNCSSTKLRDLGFVGELAPFFLKRVFNIELGLSPSNHPLKRFLRRLPGFPAIFDRVYKKAPLVQMQICTACLFVQTASPFPDELLGNLYVDYRSESYNRERIRYEPEYARIAVQVGASTQELQTRKKGLTEWLETKIDVRDGFTMLDYGGADGKFLPDLSGKKYVFDISDIAPAPGIVRVNDETELGRYAYVQVAHVLEHVSNPLGLAKKAASLLSDGGYLYIEVPQELSDAEIRGLSEGQANGALPIHEHINQYCARSVTELLRALGLSCEAVSSDVTDLGWIKSTIVRGLGRKV